MFGMGWSEMLVVGIVALIVVGPKDLPGMFRTMGEFTGKAKGMAREFSKAMNAAADDAGVSDISKTLNAAANPKAFGVDKLREAAKLDLDPESETGKLSAERAASKAKMLAATAKSAEARKAAETAARSEALKPVSAAAAKPKAAASKAAKTGAAKAGTAKKAATSASKTSAAKPKATKPKAAAKPKAKATPKAKPEANG